MPIIHHHPSSSIIIRRSVGLPQERLLPCFHGITLHAPYNLLFERVSQQVLLLNLGAPEPTILFLDGKQQPVEPCWTMLKPPRLAGYGEIWKNRPPKLTRGFLKWGLGVTGLPLDHPFVDGSSILNMLKPTIRGYPHFRKPPWKMCILYALYAFPLISNSTVMVPSLPL